MIAIIKGLLRSYEGIFDYPSSINENHLAKFISVKKEKLIADLNRNKKNGHYRVYSSKRKSANKISSKSG